MLSTDTGSLADRIRDQYNLFEQQVVLAPTVHENGRFIGVDNRQQSQYDLIEIRGRLPKLPLVQVVGDSGSAFDTDKIPSLQRILSEHAAHCLVEYGFTSAKHDTNWLVGEHLKAHPEAIGVANVVRQSIDALETGFDGTNGVAIFLILLDRLSPTRFGDDVWLSDGIMFKYLGDKMICFEGGPQALYQSTNALVRGIEVLVVTNLRPRRFSAARILADFKRNTESNLALDDAADRQINIARWCVAMLKASDLDITNLIVPIEV